MHIQYEAQDNFQTAIMLYGNTASNLKVFLMEKKFFYILSIVFQINFARWNTEIHSTVILLWKDIVISESISLS